MSDHTQEIIDSYVRGLESLRKINSINREELLRIRDMGKDIKESLKKQEASEESLRKAIDDVANLYATMTMNEKY